MSMGSRPSVGQMFMNFVRSLSGSQSRRGLNRIGHKTQGRANSSRSRRGRIRYNSHKWGGPAQPRPKLRAKQRERRAGFHA